MPDSEEYMEVEDVIKPYRPDDIGRTFATSSTSEKVKGFVAMFSIFIVLLIALLLALGSLDD